MSVTQLYNFTTNQGRWEFELVYCLFESVSGWNPAAQRQPWKVMWAEDGKTFKPENEHIRQRIA